ncbi:DUF4083 domain-containing protein [Paenisporosarcina quisquiliarum]|uniref:DUF4083 domain-containing protein n=1 Tax=Paenisporosarcina quisquiliarum TaxID=365346 RepID=UPI0037370C0B
MILILTSEHTVQFFSIGDAIFQLILLAILAGIIGFIISIVRSNKGRKNQLDRIEKKVDFLNKL